ncbi:hypothetical protein [Vibrio parahaemolyticus]|uniref:hypothetical protein n=1 Tax=Vibrio parahaemolyticus TaxID=670 RepID=UPI001EEA06A4|nr:hypothetical protein [Vibrio parahaemolyticus]MCG6479698.1 hypothetical protein [Vibrio parahaemolyticus]HCG6765498.1 hypothetical protein [Vibrio parahaemolyticus]
MSNLVEKILIGNANFDAESSEFLISVSPHYPTILITALIGLGSILTSMAVVYITRKNQESQNKAKLSELRYQWLREFRASGSDYIGVCTHIRSCTKNDTFEHGQLDLLQTKAYTLRSQIILMLDVDDIHRSIVESLTKDLINYAFDIEVHDDDYLALLDENRTQLQVVANTLWSEVKAELN